MSNTFEEELGSDIGFIKSKIESVVEQANSPSNVDIELRNILLSKTQSFIDWLTNRLTLDTSFTKQDIALVETNLFNQETCERLKDKDPDIIHKLLERHRNFMSHPMMFYYFGKDVTLFLDKGTENYTYLQLADQLRSDILMSSKQSNYTPTELLEWYMKKIGFFQTNKMLGFVVRDNFDTIKSNKSLVRFLLSWGRSYAYDWTNVVWKFYMDNPDFGLEDYPLRQIDWSFFNNRNNQSLVSSGLYDRVASSYAQRLAYNYFQHNYGNEFFRDHYTGVYDYNTPPYKLENLMWESLTDVEFQRVLDNQLDQNIYFMPLFYRLPLASYNDLISLKNFNAGKNYITSYDELLKSIDASNMSNDNKTRVKTQFSFLPYFYKYLENDSIYFHRVRRAFETPQGEEKDKNLANQMYKIFYERYTGLAPLFLYMMDSGNYTELFKLITEIPNANAFLFNSVKSGNPNENLFYTLIPWIATNRIHMIPADVRKFLETRPLWKYWMSLPQGKMNNLWAQYVLLNKLNGIEYPSESHKARIKALPNYKEMTSSYSDKELLLLDLEPVELNASWLNQLRRASSDSITKTFYTLSELKALNYKKNLPVNEIQDFSDLLGLNIINFTNFNIDFPALSKSNELQYEYSTTLFKALANKVNADAIYKYVLSNPNYKYLNRFGLDSTPSTRNQLKSLAANDSKAIIVFYSLGTYNNINKAEVVTGAYAPKNDNDPVANYTSGGKDAQLRAGTLSYSNVVVDNVGIRPDNQEKITSNLSGVWFRTLEGFEAGDGYIGCEVFEYTGP